MNLTYIALGLRLLPQGTQGKEVQGWRICVGAFGILQERRNRFSLSLSQNI
jgi:hypothetical protein